MEGLTPVSALMHAGIVNADGFLINRFAPVFAHTDSVLQIALLVGVTTRLMGSLMMLMQRDIKRSLGYSTMGQMGYIVMKCSLGAFSLAIFHLVAHGIFKTTLFLDSGSLIGRARKDSNIPEGEIYQFMVERRTPRPPLCWPCSPPSPCPSRRPSSSSPRSPSAASRPTRWWSWFPCLSWLL
jgi:NADH-quinone oxidoreductase subunit L